MIKLVRLSEEYKHHLFDIMEEWTTSGEKIIPYSIRRLNYQEFEVYLNGFHDDENRKEEGKVPSTTYWGYDTQRDIFVGAVNIRHFLNEQLLLNGGHIGDGIRPSERRKGYATKLIGLALEVCKDMGLSRVLMVCDQRNIGSRKSIINNGGILENELLIDGVLEQRFWIDLNSLN
jgi:predicted acetyltransferase